jgi:protein arginine kinase activator
MSQCSACGQANGVVDLTHIEAGEVKTVHLCAQCAAAKGIQTPAAIAETPLGGLLAALGTAAPAAVGAGANASCGRCGCTLAVFRETGRVGCADCYEAFGEPLRELVRRLHGSAHHTGKTYRPPGDAPRAPAEGISELRARLRQAVEREQFELAAALRDRLKDRG